MASQVAMLPPGCATTSLRRRWHCFVIKPASDFCPLFLDSLVDSKMGKSATAGTKTPPVSKARADMPKSPQPASTPGPIASLSPPRLGNSGMQTIELVTKQFADGFFNMYFHSQKDKQVQPYVALLYAIMEESKQALYNAL
jgi:hypothetical protein